MYNLPNEILKEHFLSNRFFSHGEVKSSESKKRIQAVSMVAGILLIFLFTVKSQMLVTEEYEGPRIRSYQAMPLICYVVLSGLICLMLLWKGRIKNKFVSQLMAVLSLIIMPFVSFFVFEMVAENFFTVIHNTQKGMIILNLNYSRNNSINC